MGVGGEGGSNVIPVTMQKDYFVYFALHDVPLYVVLYCTVMYCTTAPVSRDDGELTPTVMVPLPRDSTKFNVRLAVW